MLHQVTLFIIDNRIEIILLREYSQSADVWAFGNIVSNTDDIPGVTMYEMLEAVIPYYQIDNNEELIQKVCHEGVRLEKPKRIPIPGKCNFSIF